MVYHDRGADKSGSSELPRNAETNWLVLGRVVYGWADRSDPRPKGIGGCSRGHASAVRPCGNAPQPNTPRLDLHAPQRQRTGRRDVKRKGRVGKPFV